MVFDSHAAFFFVIFDFFLPSSPLWWGPLSLLSYTRPLFNHSPFYLNTILTLHIGEYRKTDIHSTDIPITSPAPRVPFLFRDTVDSVSCMDTHQDITDTTAQLLLLMHTVMRRRAEKSTEKRKTIKIVLS